MIATTEAGGQLFMNIALIGYGSMGLIIRNLAEQKGHVVGAVIDDGDAALSQEHETSRVVSELGEARVSRDAGTFLRADSRHAIVA